MNSIKFKLLNCIVKLVEQIKTENITDSMINFLSAFPTGSDGQESVCKAGASGLIPGSGRSPGEGNGN